MPERSESASVMVGKKVAALALVVATIVLAINDLFDYGILVRAAVVIFVGTLTPPPSRWLAAALLAAAVVAGHLLVPPPAIDEGHNVFLPGPDAARTSGLPQAVYAFLDRQVAEQYPPAPRCADQSRGRLRPPRPLAQGRLRR